MPVKMNKIESSTIKSIGWRAYTDEPDRGVLFVRFVKGGPKGYKYENVPERIFHHLMNANIVNEQISVGSLFHDLVKKHPDLYPYTNLDKPEG